MDPLKIAYLGGSKGLGLSVLNICDQDKFLFSRSATNVAGNFTKVDLDFTKPKDQQALLEKLKDIKCSHIYYFAGGGPYGKFSDQKLRSHEWAMELNLIFPVRLLHWALKQDFIKQVIFVGSAIAEARPDPRAASYAAAKHGLKGLISSINAEGCSKDIRLFSPGYMDTDMVPKGAEVRSQTGVVMDPDQVAQSFIAWSKQGPKNWHLEIKTESQLLN